MLCSALSVEGVRAAYTTGEQLTARQRMLMSRLSDVRSETSTGSMTAVR
jgi:hypothetical protein